MFMVISGYLYKAGRSYKWNVMHRVVPLIIVLVASTVILTSLMYGYMYILGYDLSSYDLLSDIWTVIIGKGCFENMGAEGFTSGYILAPYDISAGYYYLQILAVGCLIFYAIVDHVVGDWRQCTIAIVSLMCVTGLYMEAINIQLPFSAQLGPVVAAFLLFGALLRRYNVAEYIENGYHEKKYWIIFFALFAVAMTCIVLFPSGMKIYNTTFGSHGAWSVLTFLALSISCGIVLWYIIALVIRIPIVSDIFTFAGVNSLILYTWHTFIAKLYAAPFYTMGTEYWITMDSMATRFSLLIATLITIFAVIMILGRIKRAGDEAEIDIDANPDYRRH